MTSAIQMPRAKPDAVLHLDALASEEGVCVRFSEQASKPAEGFILPLQLLDGLPAETWWLLGESAGSLPVQPGISAAASGDLLVCEAYVEDTTDPREAAKTLYLGLFEYLDAAGFPHIVKGWNYLADINEGDGDGERYKQFCLGRGEALDAAWKQDYLPAGTGVGAGSEAGLRVTLLASRERPELIENPRQISAYRYPRQYGPKSPSFSRAAAIGGDRRWLFISGTAAIVGHDSLHTSSLEGQISETLRNWDSLFDAYEAKGQPRPELSEKGWYRIYLRHAEHLDEARALLEQAGLPLHRTRFFLADICRRELLFEMDGAIDLG